MEVWKNIKGYEGYYQISNKGRVKSLKREIYYKNGKIYIYPEKIRVLTINNVGYYKVNLSKNNKTKQHTVHKLVAVHFLNHKPDGYNLVIDHIDNNKLNNNVNNLQIVTHRFNSSKRKKTGTSKYLGVHYCNEKNKWISRIQINGKNIYLGSFKQEKDAYNTYKTHLEQIKKQ